MATVGSKRCARVLPVGLTRPLHAPLFRSVVTPKIDRLAQVVAACRSIPDYHTTLVPMLRGFGSAHRVFGADRLHYAPVGVALLAALSGANEAEWTSETAELWSRIIGLWPTRWPQAWRMP